jgi:hypothetical protein
MTTSTTRQSVSRRTALVGLGAGGLGLALTAATARHASAQDTAAAMAKHPLVGTWLAGASAAQLTVTHFGADGNLTQNGFLVGTSPDNRMMMQSSPFAGVWEPDGARGIHITFTALTFDATGAVTGSITVDGYPVANEDGNSFWDDGTRVKITFRDVTGAITQVGGPVPPVAGVRITPGKPGYEEALAMLATGPAATPTP